MFFNVNFAGAFVIICKLPVRFNDMLCDWSRNGFTIDSVNEFRKLSKRVLHTFRWFPDF